MPHHIRHGSKLLNEIYFVVEKKVISKEPLLQLILDRIRLYARRRILWLRKLWQEEGENGGPLVVTHAAIDAILDDRDAPGKELEWYQTDPDAQAINQQIAEIERKIAKDKKSSFTHLIRTLRLSHEEADLLQVCLAIKLDPTMSRLYAYLQDHAGRGYATQELVQRLFGYGQQLMLKSDSALTKWALISEKPGTPGEPTALQCDPFIAQWLTGCDGVDASLAAFASEQPAKTPLEQWPVKETVDLISRILKVKSSHIRIRIAGLPRSGRRTLATIICAQLNMKLLTIDSDRAENWSQVFVHAQRQALLDHCAIAWYGDKVLKETWLQGISNARLQFIICEKKQHPLPLPGTVETTIELPELTIDEQTQLLQQFVPVSQTWKMDKRNEFVATHRMTIGDFTAFASRDVQMLSEAKDILRESARHKLGELAQLLECPFHWNDMIVPENLERSLKDFVFEARERKTFWEQDQVRRLFPQGRGLIALFSGPSGTGKTMAAQVIAAELGLDLYRIDLSSVVSKYVGETSQNLERILSRAEYMDIVLLFDEADALFGKRTEVRDAHDRFANTDTNYLLQAIENYQGIALLSSNKKENIDAAFIRRLRYALAFPKPDATLRKKIWMQLLQEMTQPKKEDKFNGQLDKLASQLELTGAQIKFALLSAQFIAKKEKKNLAMPHLLAGLNRELMKAGRTLSKRESAMLLAYA